jgi:hypothetical protein
MPKKKSNAVARPVPISVALFRELKQAFADLRSRVKEIITTRRRRHVL